MPLTNIFNLCLNTNVIPSLWKSAFVVPLLKGGDPSILNNYRPISKLSVLVKVLESLVSDQLKDFFNNKNVLSDFQSGFRKRHSTTSAALKVLNDFIFFVINIFYLFFHTQQHNIHSKQTKQNNRHILHVLKVQTKGRERGWEKNKQQTGPSSI